MPQRFLSRTATVLWIAATLGTICVMPYANVLMPNSLTQASARIGQPIPVVIAISITQSTIILAILTFSGLWAARKVGMGAPLLDSWLGDGPWPADVRRSVLLSTLLGIGAGALIVLLDLAVFVPLGPKALAAAGATHPPVWMSLLASFEGGITEEVELRLFLLSFLALGYRYVTRFISGNREAALGPTAFWIANIIAAILFGLGHLPATAQLMPLTPLIVTRALVLNGVAGVIAGYLFWRRGIEMAMLCHFSADIVLHVMTPLLLL